MKFTLKFITYYLFVFNLAINKDKHVCLGKLKYLHNYYITDINYIQKRYIVKYI